MDPGTGDENRLAPITINPVTHLRIFCFPSLQVSGLCLIRGKELKRGMLLPPRSPSHYIFWVVWGIWTPCIQGPAEEKTTVYLLEETEVLVYKERKQEYM